uniref:tetratricopeptide repeat protein n=1 Tax=Prevotella sp. TaxID=59823 RepID=UPI0027E33773
YKLGNEHRRKGDWQHALDNYLEAIALDPQSPAVEAKRMLDDILAYRCKDMYNP